jgi:hypothetical protein
MTTGHPASVGHARSADDACSVLSEREGTSAHGTAAAAGFFVVVEQPGPWGRVVARESHLPDGLGVELDARASALGGRFMLIRRPGEHADRSAGRRVLLAHAGPDPASAWLLAADVPDAGALLALDWSALARGKRDLVRASLPGATEAEPALLICTNGRRDVCCAVRGRPVAAAAGAIAPDRVWEVSHTGGHRFAPTGVLLPWGQYFARLDARSAGWILAASRSGHVPRELLGPHHDRGRSALSAPAQVAESFVRALTSETRLSKLVAGAATSSPRGHLVPVSHADGRRWVIEVRREPTGNRHPESCRKSPVEVHEFVASVAPRSALTPQKDRHQGRG